MGVQQGALLFGTDLGPILGGLAGDHLGLRWPFFIAGLLGGVAAIWTATRLPNRPPRAAVTPTLAAANAAQPRRQSSREALWSLLTDPTFLMVGLFTLVVFLTRTGSRQTLIPWLGNEDFGMTATQIGLLMSLMTTITFALIVPAGWLSDRFGRKPAMVPGMALTAVALFIFAGADSLTVIYLAGVVMGFGQGISGPSPAAYVADLAPPGRTSASMGLYRTFGDAGLIIGPWGLGAIADRMSLSAGLITNAALAGAAALGVAIVAREPRVRRKGSGLRGGGG
jgi:MFS family permease